MPARKALLLALLFCGAARAQEIPLELPPPPWLHKSEDGTLVLRSRPKGAAVRIDGRELGPAPLAAKLAPGKHLVRIARPGYAPFESASS